MRVNTREMTVTALFTVLMIISAKIVIPLAIIPVTLQTAVSLSAGILLGWRGAIRVHMLYLLMGLVGLPVFASGGGIAYVLQPSFGYLPGMLLGSGLIGWLVERADPDRQQLRRWQAIIFNVAGLMVIYSCGVSYLYILNRTLTNGSITLIRAIQVGMLPFLVIDLIFAIVVALAAPMFRRVTSTWLSMSTKKEKGAKITCD